jgi:hypothetical protein
MAKDPIWGESGLSIILLPSGEQGDALFEVAKAWTKLKLLTPSMWVRAELLDTSKGNPPRQTAIVLGASRSTDLHEVHVDLFEQLARQNLGQIRLLVVRTAAPSIEFDKKQDDLVELLGRYLDQSVPKVAAAKDQDAPAATFSKINLLTGPTEFIPENQDRMVNPLFNAHFVASTEDRSSPLAGDAFVRYEPTNSRFAGFTMLHVATLAALWQGLPRGGYELAKKGNWSGDKVFVSRVFVSAILTDGLIQRACARVLKRAANARDGFTDLALDFAVEGTYPIPDSAVDGFIEEMVNLTFGFRESILEYKPAVEVQAPSKFRFGPLRQLGDFFIFSGNKLLRIPFYAGLWFWKKFVDGLNAIFQAGGKGAAEVVGPEEHLDPRDLSIIKKYDQVAESKKKADEALNSPVRNSPVRSTPELWEKIRKLVFGFLDGSNLSLFGIKKQENGWPIFYRVSSMFSDPADTLQVPDPVDRSKKLSLKWMDLAQASEVQTALTSQVVATEQSMSQNVQKVIQAGVDMERLEEEIRELQLHLDISQIESADAVESEEVNHG